MDFSTIKTWIISEGEVTQVVDSEGNILWKKETSSETWPNLIYYFPDALPTDLSTYYTKRVFIADASYKSNINNYYEFGKGVSLTNDKWTVSLGEMDEIEVINYTDAMETWDTDYLYIGISVNNNPKNSFQCLFSVSKNEFSQSMQGIINKTGDQEFQTYLEDGQNLYQKDVEDAGSSAYKTAITVVDPLYFGWSLSTTASWLSLEQTSGVGRKTVAVSVAKNPSTSSRTATISLNSLITGETISSVTITQPGASTTTSNLSISPQTIIFGKSGGTDSLTIKSTESWTIKVEPNVENEVISEMPTLSKTSGSGNAKIQVGRTALESSSTTKGIYMWTISVHSTSSAQTCDVIQDLSLVDET